MASFFFFPSREKSETMRVESDSRETVQTVPTEAIAYRVQELLEDVNASNAEKNTALHWACLNGQIEVVKALILGGATVSALNSHERTPMDEAVNRGKMEVVDAISTAVAQVELDGVTIS